jgi:signal transduction histidine kinase
MKRVVTSLRWWDVLLPAGLAAVAVAEMVGTRPVGWGWAIGLEVLAALLLVWRRDATLWVTSLAAIVLLQMPFIGPQLDDAAAPILYCAVCGYALGRWIADLRGLAGIGVILVAFFLDYSLVDARTHGIGDVIFVLTLIVPPYVFGRVTRRMADQAEEHAAAQELVRAQAVRDERDRIARELHDVIAHSVSAMVVQTAAAQDLVRTDPDRASTVLADVAATGRRALAETGRLLHVIRDTDDELGLEPAPGLAQVPVLVERFRADGLHVDLDLAEPVPSLPAGVDVSAYRIVQEALTNALRYAADRRAILSVAATADRLSIRATNAANGVAAAGGLGSGLGLLGVAERVSLLGGTLHHGTREDRFELDATLPVGP